MKNSSDSGRKGDYFTARTLKNSKNHFGTHGSRCEGLLYHVESLPVCRYVKGVIRSPSYRQRHHFWFTVQGGSSLSSSCLTVIQQPMPRPSALLLAALVLVAPAHAAITSCCRMLLGLIKRQQLQTIKNGKPIKSKCRHNAAAGLRGLLQPFNSGRKQCPPTFAKPCHRRCPTRECARASPRP